MKTLKFLFFILLVCFFVLVSVSGCSDAEKETIAVGSKDFTEQHILGNMLVLFIEANTDFAVTYNDNMASHVIFAAIETGVIDLYIDYIGTIYGYYLNMSESKDLQTVYDVSAR